ncbi:MAG: GTP-binding protein [Candidatus Saccharibacteria bacterium]|nr:GTP-binding protein [Candidatus Saccharibacteria bacterium]
MSTIQDPTKIRNIAIIAHVDHGKTTLVDGLLKQSKTFRDNQAEMSQDLIMDSGDQEKERGITITAKVTAVQHDDYRINIVDTPGHADFSGEVERTLNMADGCILVVDAQEGPMPQTKFVLSKALAAELKPIVIINKIDKGGSRIKEVENELADLFLELAVHEDQLHYPVYYAIARDGKSWESTPENPEAPADLETIFQAIIKEIPAPAVELNKPFQMLVTALAYDTFKGKYAIGRIRRGNVKSGDTVTLCQKDGGQVKARVDNVYMSQGVIKFEVPRGVAGDIVQLTGIANAQIGETIADADEPEALPIMEVEAPTLKIYLGPNTSPFKGTEGEYTTSRQIGERLHKELETNVGLRVEEDGIGFLVSGRGELHLSVLIETMRREGYEFEVGRPTVVLRKQMDVPQGMRLSVPQGDSEARSEPYEGYGEVSTGAGNTAEGQENQRVGGSAGQQAGSAHAMWEPIEELVIEVPAEHVGSVQMELGKRRAELIEQFAGTKDVTKLVYKLPTRALLGLRNIMITNTKGTIIMNSLMIGYQPLGAPLQQLRNGVLIAFEAGTTTPYSLETAASRGEVFVGAAEKVYAGQIVGLNKRQEDMEINVCKAKHLTNMRSSSSDGVVQLTPPTILSLEECLDFIEKDELLEVTPKNLRLRKRELDPNKRKRANKK